MIQHSELISSTLATMNAAAPHTSSGLDFAIAGYVIGLGLLLGYAALLWRQGAALTRELSQSSTPPE